MRSIPEVITGLPAPRRIPGERVVTGGATRPAVQAAGEQICPTVSSWITTA
jgi:hypothetical protein